MKNPPDTELVKEALRDIKSAGRDENGVLFNWKKFRLAMQGSGKSDFELKQMFSALSEQVNKAREDLRSERKRLKRKQGKAKKLEDTLNRLRAKGRLHLAQKPRIKP